MRAVLETNLLGLAATFQPFVAPMRERRSGTLVGIASMAAVRGLPGHAAYCASKAGVVAYCESLRGECRPSGVRVVTLLPGYVATPLTQRQPLSDAVPDVVRRIRPPCRPGHRLGREPAGHSLADGRWWRNCCACCPMPCSTA